VQSATISTGQRWRAKKHPMSSSGDHGGYIVSKWHSPRIPVNPDDEYASTSSKRKQVGNTSAKHHE